MEENKKFIDSLSPKTAFKFGLFSGLGIMFVVGFFILLGLLLNGNNALSFGKNNNNNNNVVNNANNNQPTNQGNVNNAADVSKADWVRGDSKAPITIVEYSDIDCPFCQNFHATMKQLLQQYDGDVKWVYRHFPLTSLHPNAFTKAEAVECVGSLEGNDAFWQFTDLLIEDKTITVDQLADKASGIGVDKNKFQACMDNHDFAQKIQDQANEAISAGGQGTPYSVIIAGKQRLPINGALPLAQITQQLDSLIK